MAPASSSTMFSSQRVAAVLAVPVVPQAVVAPDPEVTSSYTGNACLCSHKQAFVFVSHAKFTSTRAIDCTTDELSHRPLS
jgi:hypothetical protein